MTKRTYWIFAIISAIIAGLVYSLNTCFRLGWRSDIFVRETTFGLLFTLAVWWYNLSGFPALTNRFWPEWTGRSKVWARIISTLTFSYAIVRFDEKMQILHSDWDLEGYMETDLANEFRSLVTASIVLLASFLLDMTKRFYMTRLEIEHLQRENVYAQVEMLKQQINPHFLFNSLNVLKTLADNNDPATGEFIVRLSEFYRSSLLNDQHESVRLSEELSVLDHYIFMLKARFGGKLFVERNISPEHLDLLIPPFTLQLLLENCIKHNVVSTTRPLKVEIFSEGDWLVVRNNVQPKRAVVEHSSQTGLSNIDKRFSLLMQDSIIVEKDLVYFTVRLPLMHAESGVLAR
jgi:sensor histidine kinase YesM